MKFKLELECFVDKGKHGNLMDNLKTICNDVNENQQSKGISYDIDISKEKIPLLVDYLLNKVDAKPITFYRNENFH